MQYIAWNFSDADWPDLSDLSVEEIWLPDVVSNVENGTGVVAGIASRKIEITPSPDIASRAKNELTENNMNALYIIDIYIYL